MDASAQGINAVRGNRVMSGQEPTSDQQGSEEPYRVLSLDGGGMRGIYTAAFLARMVDQFARLRELESLDLGAGFDLITGTSTGAIVGAAIAIGRPLGEVVALYQKEGHKIFPHRIKGGASAIYRAARGDAYVRRGDKALRAALTEVLGATTMRDVFVGRRISLSIPAVLMSSHQAYVFKKTPVSGVRDDEFPLVDVCMASSAAPVFRSLAAIGVPGDEAAGSLVFADGGLWANNPVLVGLTDALANAAGRRIEIYSLGTCPRPEGELIDAEDAHRSMLDWRFGADVGPLSISAQEFAFDNMARLIGNAFTQCGRPVRTIRFPATKVPASMMPYLALDDTRPEAMTRLVQQAHRDADLTKSWCDDPNSQEGRLICALMNDLPAMPATGADWVRPSAAAGDKEENDV